MLGVQARPQSRTLEKEALYLRVCGRSLEVIRTTPFSTPGLLHGCTHSMNKMLDDSSCEPPSHALQPME